MIFFVIFVNPEPAREACEQSSSWRILESPKEF